VFFDFWFCGSTIYLFRVLHGSLVLGTGRSGLALFLFHTPTFRKVVGCVLGRKARAAVCYIFRSHTMPAKKPKTKPVRPKKESAPHGATATPATSQPQPGVQAKLGPPSKLRGKNPERVRQILAKLDQAYPNVTCALEHRNPFELLIATILSAQCTDVRVNIVTKTLFAKYRSPTDFAHASPAELETEIRSTGFFRNKTKSIIGAAQKILKDFGGEVPRTMEELLTVPGAARKTANVVLGTAYKIASGVVVDTHVQRLSERLDLTDNEDPKKIEQDLIKIIPQDKWILFSHQLIWHGRRVCAARNPRCAACNLEKLCYSVDKTVGWKLPTRKTHAGRIDARPK
jgi:endonuclease-3